VIQHALAQRCLIFSLRKKKKARLKMFRVVAAILALSLTCSYLCWMWYSMCLDVDLVLSLLARWVLVLRANLVAQVPFQIDVHTQLQRVAHLQTLKEQYEHSSVVVEEEWYSW